MSEPSTIGRLVSLLLLIFVPIAVWFFAIAPLRDWQNDNETQINDLRKQLRKAERTLSINRTILKAGDNFNGDEFIDDFLVGNKRAELLAQLQSRLQSIIVSNRSEFTSARMLSEKEIDGTTYQGLHLKMRGGYDELRKILQTLENQKPILFIDRALLNVQNNVVRGQSIPQLSADIEIFSGHRNTEQKP